MKVKNILLGGAILPVLATGALCGNTFASSGQIISFSYGEASSRTTCAIYNPIVLSEPMCDDSIANFDEANGILTLKAGINSGGKSYATIDVTDLDYGSLVVTSLQNLDVTIVAGSTNVTMELGDNITLRDEGRLGSSGHHYSEFKTLTMKSGHFVSDSASFVADAITMDGGEITTAALGGNLLTLNSGKITISDMIRVGIINAKGGELHVDGDLSSISPSGSTVKISDGSVIVNGIAYIADLEISGGNNQFKRIYPTGNFLFTGGDTKIIDANSTETEGLWVRENKTFAITGGKLTIDGYETGIKGGSNAKLYFDGGTTIIKNSSQHSVWVNDTSNPEEDIIFGENMGILEDTQILQNSIGIGIPALETITITAKSVPTEEPTEEKTNPKTSAYDNLLVLAVSAMALAVLGFSGKKLLDRR